MKFCEHCHKKLGIREEIVDGKRGVYFYCKSKKCTYKIPFGSARISRKTYNSKNNNRHKHYNKYKTKDITLPLKKSTCPNCKKTHFNRYEKKHSKNRFYINHICSHCYHNWGE